MKEWFGGDSVDPAPLASLPGWLVGIVIALGIALAAGVVMGLALLAGRLV